MQRCLKKIQIFFFNSTTKIRVGRCAHGCNGHGGVRVFLGEDQSKKNNINSSSLFYYELIISTDQVRAEVRNIEHTSGPHTGCGDVKKRQKK